MAIVSECEQFTEQIPVLWTIHRIMPEGSKQRSVPLFHSDIALRMVGGYEKFRCTDHPADVCEQLCCKLLAIMG